jgi:citrate synthase
MPGRVTATEAAARLGVKRETLYAYVSRGLLESRTALDGKTSTFDPAEVEALRSRRRRARTGQVETPILSSLTEIADQHVRIRGHDLVGLARAGTGFEAVSRLLWTGELPSHAEWPADDALARHARTAQRALPDSAPLIDRLRINLAVASAYDDLRHDLRPAGVWRAAPRLIATMVDGLPARHGAGGRSIAERLWPALSAQPPTARWIRALDAALVLLTDHDLATSTFAARVAASTRADPYSVVGAGLGALGGPLHGAASRPVHELLAAASRGRPTAAVGALLATGDRLAGFGHFLYPTGDPRARALLELLGEARPPASRLAVCDEVRELVHDRTGTEPNVDFALASLSFLAEMPPDAGEAVFAIARSAGWIAHALEEYRETPLRFRPVARYVGPR